MAGRQSRTAADRQRPDGTMRVLWVMFVVAIGLALIGAIYALGTQSGAVEKNENRTQTSHSSTSGSAFDK
jgi:hypothetical protein